MRVTSDSAAKWSHQADNRNSRVRRSLVTGFAALAIGTSALTMTSCAGSDEAPCTEPSAQADQDAFDYLGVNPTDLQRCSESARASIVADYRYLRAVNDEAVPFTSDDVAKKVGMGMCDLIERAVQNGYSVADARVLLLQQAEAAAVYSRSDNITIQTAALASYCPEYNQ